MNRRRLLPALALITLITGSPPVLAQCTNATLVVEVPPGASAQTISKASIFGADHFPFPTSQPLHGTLSDLGHSFNYIPGMSFWSLGSDSFTVRKVSVVTGSPSAPPVPEVTVFLIAQVVRQYGNYEGFEVPGTVIPQIVTSDPNSYAILPEARLFGAYGLRTYGAVGSEIFLQLGPGPGHTTGEYGSCTGTIWKPPPGGGNAPCSPTDPLCGVQGDAMLLTAGSNTSPIYSQVFTRITTGGAFLKLRAPNVSPVVETAWTPVSRTPHRLELAQLGARNLSGAQVALFVDDEAFLSLSLPAAVTSLDWPTPTFQIGLMKPVQNPGYHDFDQVAAWTLEDDPAGTCTMVESFETGAYGSGWSTFQPENLSVVSNTEMLGQHHLEVALTTAAGTTGGLLIKPVVNPSGFKAMRFRFDTKGLALTPGLGVVTIADGMSTPTKRVFRVQLDTTLANQPILRASVRLNDETWATSFVNLASFNEQHVVEVAWLTSPSSNGATGYLRMYLDGIQVLAHSNVANSLQNLIELRVGAVSTASNAVGTLRLDQIEFWGLVQ